MPLFLSSETFAYISADGKIVHVDGTDVVDMGLWSGSIAYRPNDVVQYSDALFVAITANFNQFPTSISDDSWSIMVRVAASSGTVPSTFLLDAQDVIQCSHVNWGTQGNQVNSLQIPYSGGYSNVSQALDALFTGAAPGIDLANKALILAQSGTAAAAYALGLAQVGTATGDVALRVAGTGTNAAVAGIDLANQALVLAQVGTATGDVALSIAVAGTNLAYTALTSAWTGTATANVALRVASTGTLGVAAAIDLANKALILAQVGTVTGDTALSIAVAGTNTGALLTQWFGTIQELPAGGSSAQVLRKNSATDYDFSWAPLLSSGTVVATTGTIALDFLGANFQTETLTGDPFFITTNRVNGGFLSVRLLPNGSTRTISFSSGWSWLGTAQSSISLGEGKLAVLSLTAYGPNETDVIAVYAAQP